MAKKIITSWIIVVTLVLCGCNPIPIHSECDLPKLTADLKLDVVEKIETSSYFSHECRIELPTVMQLNRDWGVLNLRLHGSPHRLWMLAIGKNKGSLEIEGSGVKEWRVFEDYEYALTFKGKSQNIGAVSARSKISVLNQNGSTLEELSFSYDVEKCTCASYDAI